MAAAATVSSAFPHLSTHEVTNTHKHNHTITETTCNFCSHLASRLHAKIQALKYARRHVPKHLYHQYQHVRIQSTTHSCRDQHRNLVCPQLLAHTCDMCGKKGHTRSRCSPCEYCGINGHIMNECPKALHDDRMKGDTIVLKGISSELRDHLFTLLENYYIHPIPDKREDTWVYDCSSVVITSVEVDSDNVWDCIQLENFA